MNPGYYKIKLPDRITDSKTGDKKYSRHGHVFHNGDVVRVLGFKKCKWSHCPNCQGALVMKYGEFCFSWSCGDDRNEIFIPYSKSHNHKVFENGYRMIRIDE